MKGATTTSRAAKPKAVQRRHRTRGAIISAGHHLFSTRALEGVTIDDIIETANVAKGSFYNHFADKESLADTIIELVQDDCERHIIAANQGIGSPAFRVVRALAVMICYAADHPDRLQAMLSLSSRRANLDSPLNAGVFRDIRAGLDRGEFHGVNDLSGMLLVQGIIIVAFDYMRMSPKTVTPAIAIREMGTTLLRALGCPTDMAIELAEAASALSENEKVQQ